MNLNTSFNANFNTQTILKIIIFYILAFGCQFLAERIYLGFWIVYLPLATAANVLFFDELVKVISFDDIPKMEGTNKYLYILALSVLSAGFAIATAIFLK